MISLQKNARYVPLKDVASGGIIMLRDTQSEQPETLVETVKGLYCTFYGLLVYKLKF